MPDAEVRQLEVAEGQRMISREALLRPKILEEEVYIPALDGFIKVRTMNVEARDRINKASKFGTATFDAALYTLLCIAHCVIEPQLSESDVEALRKQDIRIIDQIEGQLTSLHLTGEAVQLKKGSAKTTNSDSNSTSPNGSE